MLNQILLETRRTNALLEQLIDKVKIILLSQYYLQRRYLIINWEKFLLIFSYIFSVGVFLFVYINVAIYLTRVLIVLNGNKAFCIFEIPCSKFVRLNIR